MRRLALCLIVSVALATPAVGREGRIALDPSGRDAALRGSVGVTPPPAPDEAPLPLPLPVQPTPIATTTVSSSQCRTTCSRLYYFCLAGEDQRCPQNWSRCVAGCGS